MESQSEAADSIPHPSSAIDYVSTVPSHSSAYYAAGRFSGKHSDIAFNRYHEWLSVAFESSNAELALVIGEIDRDNSAHVHAPFVAEHDGFREVLYYTMINTLTRQNVFAIIRGRPNLFDSTLNSMQSIHTPKFKDKRPIV